MTVYQAFAQAAILKLLLLSKREIDGKLVDQSEKPLNPQQFLPDDPKFQTVLLSNSCMQRQLDAFDHLDCFNPSGQPNRCSIGQSDAFILSTAVDGKGEETSINKEPISVPSVSGRHGMIIDPHTKTTGATWIELWLVTVIIVLLLILGCTQLAPVSYVHNQDTIITMLSPEPCLRRSKTLRSPVSSHEWGKYTNRIVKAETVINIARSTNPDILWEYVSIILTYKRFSQFWA